MTRNNYIPPALREAAFNCPFCGVYAKHRWGDMQTKGADYGGMQAIHFDRRFLTSECGHCSLPTIWHGDTMVYPQAVTADPPSDDLPDGLKDDYEEARLILQNSPRGSAALIRLVIQKLCVHLGLPGKDLNKDIGELVSRGLPTQVQKALDVVRVIGNESVHPGTIDLNDNRDTANRLFKLVNFIVEKMITEPREIDELYQGLPATKLAGIETRDAAEN